MIIEAPEFHTKPTTPLSPLPVHPPEPSNVTVLRNQIDPAFNMTETHLAAAIDEAHPVPATAPTDNDAEDVNHDSSFSDAYEESNTPDDTALASAQVAEPEDDYAMTFDSDGENSAEKEPEVTNPAQDSPSAPLEKQQAFTEPPKTSLPIAVNGSATSSPELTTNSSSLPNPPASEELSSVPVEDHAPSHEETESGEVDIQQLLDNITAKAELQTTGEAMGSAPSNSVPSPIPQGLPAHASLPPRPQNAQNPSTPTFYQHDNNRLFAGFPSMPPPPGTTTYNAPGVSGAPGTIGIGLLPPPPSSTYAAPPGVNLPPAPISFPPQMLQTNGGNSRQEHSKKERVDGIDYGEIQWSSSVQKLYDEFLEDERGYVSDGQWDKFPAGSRLFIGNLPTEKVTKRDIFFAFHKYGRLGQISIKQAYGFVQFLQASSSYTALEREQGQLLRGRKMHLEISKPQKNTKQANGSANNSSNQRQRSPDYGRGGRNSQSDSRASYDGYDSREQARRSGDRGPPRGRDAYRPGMRSPSPQERGGFRGRDDYQAGRGGRDYYDARRSRSKSPVYDRRDGGRYRQRSPSPRSRELTEDAELSIPRRSPRDVPDVFIILIDELDRNFVSWVEGEIRGRNLKTEVMFLSPRLPIAAVIRRQILEGVHAVTQLTRSSQNSSKIPLQVFDRKGGANNVRFDEYQDLDPKIAAELVLRTKQAEAAPVYHAPQFANGQSYQQPAPASAAPAANLASLVGGLDNASLQQLLGSLGAASQQQTQQQTATQANSAIDLAGIIGGLAKQAAPQQNYQQPQQPTGNFNVASNPQLAAMLGGLTGQRTAASPQTQQNPQQSQGSQQQVENIMAQLARFRQ